MSKQSLLFCSSEVYPFAKTGGLADVSHSLPRVLKQDYNVKVVLPLYASIDRAVYSIEQKTETFKIYLGDISYEFSLYECVYEGMEYLFVYNSVLCDREFLYGTPTHGYQDNPVRFAIFNHAILSLLREKSFDIVHLNDWQCALVPLLIDQNGNIGIKTVFTIHNLAFQGIFPYETLYSIGVDTRYFTIDALEFYGQINFMKAAIAFADAVTTVSPTYAKEIMTAEFGYGLEGFLSHHQEKISGILNGLDTQHFTPSTDTLLHYPYDTLTQKQRNKKEYLKTTALKGVKKPLYTFIGRFTEQKGVSLLIESLEKIASQNCNIAILGDGDENLQSQVVNIAERYQNIHYQFTYNEKLSHQMYASADFLLMPSLFEPCGLNQMIAMRYGAIPIIHKVGGLKDSVQNYKRFNPKSQKGYGIVFEKGSAESLLHAVKNAQILYEQKKEFNKIVKHNMLCDFSWAKSAKIYKKIYTQILKG